MKSHLRDATGAPRRAFATLFAVPPGGAIYVHPSLV